MTSIAETMTLTRNPRINDVKYVTVNGLEERHTEEHHVSLAYARTPNLLAAFLASCLIGSAIAISSALSELATFRACMIPIRPNAPNPNLSAHSETLIPDYRDVVDHISHFPFDSLSMLLTYARVLRCNGRKTIIAT